MKRCAGSLFVAGALLSLMSIAESARGQIQGDTWFPIGPAPIDGFFAGGVVGRASAIAPNPANADEVWLGTAAGGVWHTRDAGLNWEPISDNEAASAIGSLALDGCDASGCAVIYAGTGENAIRRDTFHGGGLLIGSVSGGEFPTFGWLRRTGSPFSFERSSIIDIWLDPATSGGSKRLIVALSSGVTVSASEATVTATAPSPFGLYESTDNGATWAQVTVPGQAGAKPTDLDADPSNASVLFASFLGRGVWRSTDGGANWCPLAEGIALPPGCTNTTGLPDVTTDTFDHVAIAIAPSDPSTIYAAFGLCEDPLIQNCVRSIYRSSNGGDTWQQRLAGNSSHGASGPQGYSRYTHALAVDPTNANRLFLGGIDLWRSDEGGQNFVTSHASLGAGPGSAVVHSDHREVVFHPTQTSRAYTTGDGGFAMSDNGGVSWTPRNDDLQITGFHGLGSSPATGSVIGTSQDNGGQLWSGYRRWEHLPCCGDGGFSFIDQVDPMVLFAASNWGNLTRSGNGGVNWSSLNSGIAPGEARLFYAPAIQETVAPHRIYWGGQRLYRRTNAASGSWQAISPILATGTSFEIATATGTLSHVANHPTDGGSNVITAIAVAPSDTNRVYVGYYGGELFRSNGAPCDAPSCWVAIGGGVADAPITGIAIHPSQPNTAWVTVSGFSSGAHVFKTTTAGSSWSGSASGLPSGVPANAIALEPSFPDRLYVGFDSGPDRASLYRSTNGGSSWTAHDQGLPNVPVFQLSVDETRGRLYAGTHGRGAFVLGEPFISNFEGWVDDRIWDIPVYGQNFLPNQTCTMQVLQSDGTVCAQGSVDVMGGDIETDSDGVLVTSNGGFYNGKPVAWACYRGDCLGGVPIEQCYDDADGDGDPDPLSTIVMSCGGQLAIGQVVGCPPLDNPPSSLVDLGLSGLGSGSGGGGGGGGLGEEAGAAGAQQRHFTLNASVQRRDSVESLCSVKVPYTPGADSEGDALRRTRDLVNASPVCSANGVRAIVDEGFQFESEDEFPSAPRFFLDAPGIVGGQLMTSVAAGLRGATGGPDAPGCLRLSGLGVPLVQQLQIMMIQFEVPGGAAGGGEITLEQSTPLGHCTVTVPTVAGQSAASLAAEVAAAFQVPGIPGPAECPSNQNAREIFAMGPALISAFSRSLEICSSDRNVGFDLRPKGLMNLHPAADSGPSREVAASGSSATVLLSGEGSQDPDSTPGTNDDIVLFEWFDLSSGTALALGQGEQLSVPFAPGPHLVQLRVTDSGGLSDVAQALITVQPAPLLGGRLFAGFHVGFADPLGDFETLGGRADANVHARATLGFGLSQQGFPKWALEATLGFSQFTARAANVRNPQMLNLSLDAKFHVPLGASARWFLRAGPSVYWPSPGSSNVGVNAGTGLQFDLGTNSKWEAAFDFHQPESDQRYFTFSIGLLLR